LKSIFDSLAEKMYNVKYMMIVSYNNSYIACIASRKDSKMDDKTQVKIARVGLISQGFDDFLKLLRENKPDERNEEARRFAVTITELEKVYAYFDKYIKDAI